MEAEPIANRPTHWHLRSSALCQRLTPEETSAPTRRIRKSRSPETPALSVPLLRDPSLVGYLALV